jgi:hypothetical protein
MLKVYRKGISVSGPSSALAALGMNRRLIFAAYGPLMGYPAGWTNLQVTATPSSRRSRSGSRSASKTRKRSDEATDFAR